MSKLIENIIDGKACCWRCGLEKDGQEHREGWSCSHWGTKYPHHLFKVPELKDTDLLVEK